MPQLPHHSACASCAYIVLFASLALFFFSFFFFFYCYAHHRDLHSFPTRRSSDLTVAVGEPAERGGEIAVGRVRRRAAEGEARSEEHPSELQSRLHLVCRLLLEKKKK